MPSQGRIVVKDFPKPSEMAPVSMLEAGPKRREDAKVAPGLGRRQSSARCGVGADDRAVGVVEARAELEGVTEDGPSLQDEMAQLVLAVSAEAAAAMLTGESAAPAPGG